MTLVEVLLTLALLVILVSITWPTLDRAFDNQRLKKAGDLVRAEWARARVKAMSSGSTHIFQYMVEGEQYATHRRTSSEIDVESSAHDAPPGFGEAVFEAPVSFGAEQNLPEGVVFSGSETLLDSRAEMILGDASQFRQEREGWSDPIFFYPDGTTSTARLQLRNERGRFLELSLRGLTGVTTVSEVFTSGETGP